MTLHLGKLPARFDERDLPAAKYIDLSKLPKPPAQFGHGDLMPLPRLMLGNGPDDSVAPGFGGAGDCVFAMIVNAIRLSYGIAGNPAPPFTGKETIAAYSEVTGYVIGDDSTDRGTDMRAALNWWRDTGIADSTGARHKLGAYLVLNIKNLQAELEALYLMDVGVGLGIMFPPTAMSEFDEGKPWTETGASDEGHAILWDGHRDLEKVETWARDQEATTGFLEQQVDEAYALLLPEMLVDGKSPEGLDLATLKADLPELAG